MTATILYQDHFQMNRAPFDQEPDTRIFFPAAGRKTVLKSLLDDIESGKPLIKLTGSQGTGKTLTCRLLEQLLDPEKYQLISLEQPIGSYVNLLHTVCLTLGIVEKESIGEGEVPLDYEALFREHLRQLEIEGRNFVLLVDEADNLFLATLERLIRLICDTEESSTLQILLIGRLDLDANMDQLAIYCSNVDINAGYKLEPLSLEETKQYIQFRLNGAGMPGDKHLDLFSDDAINLIFQTAMGNVSLTNSLAEQGLKKACAQGMFQVDDALVQPQQSIEENVSLAVFQGYDFLKDNKWWLVAGILLVWVILMMLWPAAEKQEEANTDDDKLEIIMPEQEIVVPVVPDVAEPGEDQPVGQDEKQSVKQPQKETVRQELLGQATSEPEIVKPQGKLTKEKEVVIVADKKKRIVPIEPTPEKVEPTSEKVESIPEKKRASPPRDAEALFDERIKASASWLAWSYRGGYTVQLMVLASENAEDNLKKILVDDKYYAIKDQLYILKKNTPKTIYVYYGSYSDMEDTREARNNMPLFLRELQPYVLSIKDALKKIEE